MHPHSFGLLLAATSLVASSQASHIIDVAPRHRRHHERRDETAHLWKRSMGPSWTSKATLQISKVQTGVAAMQLTVVGSSHVLIIDKAENNPATVVGTHSAGGQTHPAWVQWLNYETGDYQTMDATTNSFCAGGSFLSNGSMVSVGGNPRVNAASYYDQNGLTAVRVFPTCNDNGCSIVESPGNLRMASSRWYAGTCRLQDGSLAILGGMTAGGFNNDANTDNPTIEFYPSKSINNGLPVYSKFLHTALNSNLFPVTWLLPGGNLFVGANERAMIYNWQTGKETKAPNFPNGVRITYPFTAASALLPLTIANKWTPEALFCGGSAINDKIKAYDMSSETPGSKQCIRMQLTTKGMKKGWIRDTDLPNPRVMGECVLTPDGQVVIVNGAQTGVAGYSNVHNVVGQSNADNPDFTGVVYNPAAAKGKRLSAKMPTSQIARMYHSVATMTASGAILIAGSNPNVDVSTAVYQTEYRIEMINPPYMNANRPSFTWCPPNINYGKSFKIIINVPAGTAAADISVVVMDFGYHTHGVAVDQRLVELTWKNWNTSNNQILVKAPKDGSYFAPGNAWLFLVVKGIPSVGQKTMMGSGQDPPFDAAANANMLAKTAKTHGAVIY